MAVFYAESMSKRGKKKYSFINKKLWIRILSPCKLFFNSLNN
ncbi:hypothetical protein BN1221_04477c [Brenneria goodwinii]|uniref:Uncharacterized protein n=1 Tax=Brenneria goodwinii TaxID=1109412 RepID=A0A0G4K1Y5_9GAMM|nr:hypothetical protein BN1221_04477c [Brenneria goodwinii]